jgi:hypothetical protein
MDPAKIEAIETLQAELIRLQRPPALDQGIFTLQADEGNRPPDEMVAVGYGLADDGNFTVQLRVRNTAARALQQAEKLIKAAAQVGYRSVLQILEKATIPTRGEVLEAAVDNRMIDPKRGPHLGVSVSHVQGTPRLPWRLCLLPREISDSVRKSCDCPIRDRGP